MQNLTNVDILNDRRTRSERERRPLRRGITSAIAMIFMVLIAMLALAFYSTITTSTTLSQNDQKGARALIAAESGIQFMRLRLAHVQLPTTTTMDQVMTELHKDLKQILEASGNLGPNTVGFVNDTITIPAEARAIIVTDTRDRSGFTCRIERVGPGLDGIVCHVTGHSGTGRTYRTKDVRLDFFRQESPNSLLQNAVATKGKFTMMKGTLAGYPGVSSDTIASVTSGKTTAPAVQMSGGILGGEIGIVKAGLAAVSGGSVHGTTNLTSIMNNYVDVVEAPEFPAIDTTIFAGYATTTYVAGAPSPLINVRIPANMGTAASPLKFAGNMLVQGIMYIESPNVIEFSGNATFNGMLVFENKGTSLENQVKFSGSATVSGLPAGATFDPLRSITGIGMVAPTTKITTAGSSDSNLTGNLFVGSFNELGSATVTVDKGTIVAMDPGNAATFNGNTTRFKSVGLTNPPSAGVKFASRFIPVDGTYLESH